MEALELQTGDVKIQAVKLSGQKVLEAELANAKDRSAQQKAIETMLSSFKKSSTFSICRMKRTFSSRCWKRHTGPGWN